MNKRYHIKSRLLSLILSMVLVFDMFPAHDVMAAKQTKKSKTASEERNDREYERIDISNAKEFAEFTKKCYIDSWSQNKYISLKADIDLTGTEYKVIPVFSGIFDGTGHKIKGFNYTGDGYVAGLFRYIKSQGMVQNLTLMGNVESENEKECIGSICGVNYGTIKNCTFVGSVSGRDTVGGIVGINESTGTVSNCTVKGSVTGYFSTGGIAGINHGTLNGCSNRAGINNDSEWVLEDDEMSSPGILDRLAQNDDNELRSGIDTGGIAGFSDGLISSCTNYATVGYEHTGYNIGGIAGRQSGVVSLSTNSGTVYGRKDVGGIVGQMEPFIEIDEAESLRNAVNKLHKLIEKTLNDAQATKDIAKQDFDTLISYSDNAIDAADALAEQLGDFTDDNLDQMQSLADRIDRVMEMTPAVFDDFEAAENSFANAINAFKEASDDMGDITTISDEAYDVSKNMRITMLHTVGGYIYSNTYNPSAGETVKITARAEDVQGDYKLSRINVINVTNGAVVATSTTSPLEFRMPAENVRIEAYFEPGSGISIKLEDAPPETNTGSDTNETESDTNNTGSDTTRESKTEQQLSETESSETTESTEMTESTETQEPAETEVTETPAPTELETTDITGTPKTEMARTYAHYLYGAKNTSPASAIVKISSNLSGSASCLLNSARDTVTVTAQPSGSYTLEYMSLNGSRVSMGGGNSYSFSVENGREYNVYFSFRKVETKSDAAENAKTEIDYAIREAQDAASRINDKVTNGTGTISAAELQKMLSATTTVMENTAILAEIYGEQAARTLRKVNEDLNNAADHLKSALDSVKAATKHSRDIVDYVNSQPDLQFAKLGEQYDINRTNLHDQLKGMTASLKLLSDNASNYSSVVNADLKAVNDQINVIFNLLADRLSGAEKLSLEELYQDVDVDDIESITTGRADECTNKGVVKGDINIGGIAGSMSIDDEDPEDSAAGALKYEVDRRFIIKCIVTGGVNEGYVTAKKNGAGGIAGYMNHGIIVNSEGYGSVESTEGDYVGGICGESLTIIKNCYSICSVAGNKNVGGIAGYADTLTGCYSMADVQSVNGKAGAIAGQIAEYETSEAKAKTNEKENKAKENKVSNNYYVGGEIQGIDNISYAGMAEPLEYDELLTVKHLPEQFWHLKVIYKIDDTYLGSEEVKYGALLNRLNFPSIPQKEGFYGVWPDVSDKKMGGTVVIKAEYKNNITVVQSNYDDKSTQDGQSQKPYALVENIFTEDTILTAKIIDKTPPPQIEDQRYVIYEVALENSGIKENDTFALRLLNPYEDAVVYVYRNDTWAELESKPRGQYLQVGMTGTHEYFCVVEQKSQKALIIACAASGAVALILIIAMIKKLHARRKRKKAEKKTKEDNKDE